MSFHLVFLVLPCLFIEYTFCSTYEILTPTYGAGTIGQLKSDLNQGRINGINEWKIGLHHSRVNLSLVITNWSADNQTSHSQYGDGNFAYRFISCASFSLASTEYIDGYYVEFSYHQACCNKSSEGYLIDGLGLHTSMDQTHECGTKISGATRVNYTGWIFPGNDSGDSCHLAGWSFDTGEAIASIDTLQFICNAATASPTPIPSIGTLLWYDSADSYTGWTTYGEVVITISPEYCKIPNAFYTKDSDSEIISSTIPTLDYHHIKFEFTIASYYLSNGDYCDILYWDGSLWTLLVYYGPKVNMNPAIDELYDLPSSVDNTNILQVGLRHYGTHDQTGEGCIWDELSVYGTLITENPSVDPTVSPSGVPTRTTWKPTGSPTIFPSGDPSNAPTSPSIGPTTDDPTVEPTFEPSISSGNTPTPSKIPTPSPSDKLTGKPGGSLIHGVPDELVLAVLWVILCILIACLLYLLCKLWSKWKYKKRNNRKHLVAERSRQNLEHKDDNEVELDNYDCARDCNLNASECSVVKTRLLASMQSFEQWLSQNNPKQDLFVDPLHYNMTMLQNVYNHVLSQHKSDHDLLFMYQHLSNNNERTCGNQTCIFINDRDSILGLQPHQPHTLQVKTELFFKLHLYIIHADLSRLQLSIKNQADQVIMKTMIESHKRKTSNDSKLNASPDSHSVTEGNTPMMTTDGVYDECYNNFVVTRGSGFQKSPTQQKHQLQRFVIPVNGSEVDLNCPMQTCQTENSNVNQNAGNKNTPRRTTYANNEDNVYRFGIRWEYWKRDREDGNRELYVEKSYRELKEELLNNRICRLSLAEWLHTSSRAVSYMKCDKVLALSADGVLCYYYGVVRGSPVSVSHIETLIAYCNFDELQSSLSSTFRMTEADATLQQVRKRNAECANWSRLLREAVEIYGEPMRAISPTTKRFFHGITHQLVFSSTIACFASPTSTTTKLAVAYNFATASGLVLALVRYGLDVCSFDCSWLSNYTNEDERLFVGGYQPLVMRTIYVAASQTRLNLSVVAINLLQMLLQQRFNQEVIAAAGSSNSNSNAQQQQEMMMYKLRDKLERLIKTKIGEGVQQEGKLKPKYVNRLFAHICNNWSSPISISIADLNNESRFMLISDLFYADQERRTILDFGLLFELFPLCPKFSFNGDSNNDGLLLSAESMQRLLDCLAEVRQQERTTSLNQIEINQPNEKLLVISECVRLFKKKFESIWWVMLHDTEDMSLLLTYNPEPTETNG